ncbi:TM2 domain-containing protein [Nesterenkonia sp. F]|uniref:TM2 domain-containing protein n=1 Tax=Nesterenkonia sp. F TaxID=795955 RepID=UPI000255CA0C|nr:TM2 domain-containing protein [Nesterenkonia sp. F]
MTQHPPQYPGAAPTAPRKSFIATWLLSWLLGGLGIDRFYLGKVGTGLLKLVTFGGLGIWYLIDLIMVLVGATRDKQGQPLDGTRPAHVVAWAVTGFFVVVGAISGIVIGATTAQVAEDVASDVEAEADAGGADAQDQATEDEATDDGGSEEASSDDAAAEEAAEEGSEQSAEQESSDDGDAAWITEEYGEFDAVQESGSGDSVISLREGATGGIVTAEHSGSGNFSIAVLDESNQSTGELLVNTIGSYSGDSAWGISAMSEGTSLEISADGDWSLQLQPFTAAEAMPESGSGDGVYRYDGDAGTLHATHDGSGNFTVSEDTGSAFELGLLINEIGTYDGSVALQEGPSLITVSADGNWTLEVE